MNAEQFAKGFERPPREYASLRGKEWQDARDALVDPSMRWSHLFSHIIDDYLTGGDIHFIEARRNIGIYTGNSVRHLLSNVIATTEQAAVYKPALLLPLNRMNFHTINQEMGEAWLHLIEPTQYRPLDYIHLTSMQTRLAIQGLRLVEKRRAINDQLHTLEPQFSAHHTDIDQSFVGRITEVDAAIALLQVAKELPYSVSRNLTILPAPGKYEGFQGKASDFLIFDTKEWQAHGVQVKTRLVDRSGYDKAFVSFVDGVNDLGNYTLKKRPRGKPLRQVVPGLISADFILNNEDIGSESGFARLPEFQGTLGAIIHARDIAGTMEPYLTHTNRASRAAAKIGPRLLNTLGMNRAEESEEPDDWPDSAENE